MKDDLVDSHRWGGNGGWGSSNGRWGDDNSGGEDGNWGSGVGTARVSMDNLEAMMNDCKMRPHAPSSRLAKLPMLQETTMQLTPPNVADCPQQRAMPQCYLSTLFYL